MPNEQEDNQALKLQQLFEEVNNQQPEETKESTRETELIEIDVLNLPPRSEVHKKSKISWRLNFKRPFWRFLLVLLILIGVVIGVYIMFGEQIILYFT